MNGKRITPGLRYSNCTIPWLIAASNSHDDVKAVAGAVCVGVNDQDIIHAVLEKFGRVELGDGDFYGDTVYLNSNFQAGGNGRDGLSMSGFGPSLTTVHMLVSVGNRNAEGASQSQGASNSITLGNLSINGAVELYSCQRSSKLESVRITPTNLYAQGLYALFCNTLRLEDVRVDVGGNDVGGIVLDSCPNMLMTGGGSNYNKFGIKCVMSHPNSVRATSVHFDSIHLEGNRESYFDAVGIGSGSARLHIVTSNHWQSDQYPTIHLHGIGGHSVRCFNIHNSMVNGSGGGGTGTLVELGESAQDIWIDHNRFANGNVGIRIDSQVTNDSIDIINKFEGLNTNIQRI